MSIFATGQTLTTTAAPAEWIDSSHATRRLLITLALMTLGNASMYVMAVVLPAVQAEFGVGRGNASFPYTLMMLGFGLGGMWMGKLADRRGVMTPLLIGAVGTGLGFTWAGMSGSLLSFSLAHGVMLGLLGRSVTFAPLLADTALWWNKRRGIAVAVCASGNYLAGTVWPALAQRGIDAIGWRDTYLLLGLVCGGGMALLGSNVAGGAGGGSGAAAGWALGLGRETGGGGGGSFVWAGKAKRGAARLGASPPLPFLPPHSRHLGTRRVPAPPPRPAARPGARQPPRQDTAPRAHRAVWGGGGGMGGRAGLALPPPPLYPNATHTHA
jgi:MFS family permease